MYQYILVLDGDSKARSSNLGRLSNLFSQRNIPSLQPFLVIESRRETEKRDRDPFFSTPFLADNGLSSVWGRDRTCYTKPRRTLFSCVSVLRFPCCVGMPLLWRSTLCHLRFFFFLSFSFLQRRRTFFAYRAVQNRLQNRRKSKDRLCNKHKNRCALKCSDVLRCAWIVHIIRHQTQATSAV